MSRYDVFRPSGPTALQNVSGATPPNNADWEKLDALIEELPPGIPILPPEDAANFSKYTHRPRHVYDPGDGWKHCARALEKYDAELCKGYREEIDTLLVFAGLFSAVVTAFTIESYQWLQADPNDAIIVLLSHIAQSVSPNGTTAPLVSASAGLSGAVSVRINIYWLLALSLSLLAALVAILCKQWIREFERNIGMSPKGFVALHHTKLEGFENWKVAGIISLLPLLLQVALAVFALGILELLWRLHHAVAAVVCVPVIIALLFYTATTVLPVLQSQRLEAPVPFSMWHKLSQCPYKSPQALLIFRVWYLYLRIRPTISRLYSYLASAVSHALHRALQRQGSPPLSYSSRGRMRHYPSDVLRSWHDLSLRMHYLLDHACEKAQIPLPVSLYRSLRWLRSNCYYDNIHEFIWHCLWETATNLKDPEDSRRRGFWHVYSGLIDVPRIGSPALALGYLLDAHTSELFAAEACIQHLRTLDFHSAEFLFGQMYFWMCEMRDTPTAVAILRGAAAYVQSHLQAPMGHLLCNVAGLATAKIDPEIRRVAAQCTTWLYLCWLRAQPVPHQPATFITTARMAWFQCIAVYEDPEDYCTHPERLRHRPGVQELTELLRLYVQIYVPDDPLAAFSDGPFLLPPEIARPIISELLQIPLNGAEQASSGQWVDGRARYTEALLASYEPFRGRAPQQATVHGKRSGEGPPAVHRTDDTRDSVVRALHGDHTTEPVRQSEREGDGAVGSENGGADARMVEPVGETYGALIRPHVPAGMAHALSWDNGAVPIPLSQEARSEEVCGGGGMTETRLSNASGTHDTQTMHPAERSMGWE